MACIDLLRHGDTGQRGFRGQIDDALSGLGWTQMRAAVAAGQWDAIVSSPLRRCADFAKELARERNLPWDVDARLVEYHFGDWQAVPVETIALEQPQALASFWSDPAGHPPPNAERFADFQKRVLLALQDAEARQQRVLIVTHGGVVRLLRCLEQGGDITRMSAIEVPHASLHRVQPHAIRLPFEVPA